MKINRTEEQYITISTNHSFASVSFTIEMWIYPTRFDHHDIGLFSQHDVLVKDHWLHLKIYHKRLYMGFYSDDLDCKTELVTSTWYHAAFVYDYRSRSQHIYLNGIQDCRRHSAGPYLGSNGTIYIGTFRYENTYACFDG